MIDFKFFDTILYPKGYLTCEMEIHYYRDGWISAKNGINIAIAEYFTPRIRKIWFAGYYNYLTFKEFGKIPIGI